LEDIRLTVVVNDSKILGGKKEDLGFEIVYLPAIVAKFNFGEKNYHIPFSFSLISHLLRERYDVIISEGVTNIANNLLIYPVSRLCGSKYIWWGAGRRRFAKKNILRKIADPLINYLIKNANANIAYGSVARDYMVSVGADPEKVFIAQNTIDILPFNLSSNKLEREVIAIQRNLGLKNKKVILYVGAIEKRKKIENLIYAYLKVIKQLDFHASLIIVGGGSHLDVIKSMCQTKYSHLDIHFIGEIIENIGAYFKICDIFVLPSEGGLALNQAMAYGKPVVATSADGTEVDLIKQGENGYITEEDNVTALSAAILKILQDSMKRETMGKLSAKLIEEGFSMNDMVSGILLGIYKSLNDDLAK
jgi:glycosyltransferase involved in cell wall biosynthesis